MSNEPGNFYEISDISLVDIAPIRITARGKRELSWLELPQDSAELNYYQVTTKGGLQYLIVGASVPEKEDRKPADDEPSLRTHIFSDGSLNVKAVSSVSEDFFRKSDIPSNHLAGLALGDGFEVEYSFPFENYGQSGGNWTSSKKAVSGGAAFKMAAYSDENKFAVGYSAPGEIDIVRVSESSLRIIDRRDGQKINSLEIDESGRLSWQLNGRTIRKAPDRVTSDFQQYALENEGKKVDFYQTARNMLSCAKSGIAPTKDALVFY